jgi:DNA recombination-dependent growth factor C
VGLLSSSTSLTRYRITGTPQHPLKESVYSGLTKNAVPSIEDNTSPKTIGWTSFNNPYQSDFDEYSFIFGNYFAFSLRIDQKTIPVNLVNKYVAIDSARKLESTGREFLSRDEKKLIKEHVINTLHLRIPATPKIYNILWNYDASYLMFFTNLKNPNEEVETLFATSFNLRLVRLFPYTLAELACGLSDQERDTLQRLSPTKWSL